MKKYHSEKDPFRDRTIIYDEHGKKVGYSEKAIFGDHVNVYDSKGNKVARQEKSFFGDHINVYDRLLRCTTQILRKQALGMAQMPSECLGQSQILCKLHLGCK